MCTQTLYINMQNGGGGPTQSLRENTHIGSLINHHHNQQWVEPRDILNPSKKKSKKDYR